jgi:hypothetical protein
MGWGPMDLLSGRSASVGARIYWLWRNELGLTSVGGCRMENRTYEEESHGSSSRTALTGTLPKRDSQRQKVARRSFLRGV